MADYTIAAERLLYTDLNQPVKGNLLNVTDRPDSAAAASRRRDNSKTAVVHRLFGKNRIKIQECET